MTLTPTQRKQAQRSRLTSGGGKRLDLPLTGAEVEALSKWKTARGITRDVDAIKEMIGRMAK